MHILWECQTFCVRDFILWIILVGFVAGIVARHFSPGRTIPRVSS
jgi:hypothetical protein